MESIGKFPFGQPVQKVLQTDRSPKKVFVLGVYASAVHARWIYPLGKTLVNALAVASEPYIFWRGDNVESILNKVEIPYELGKLIPPNQELNGPSGIALDKLILNPIGIDRDQAWLCDLVPHSCVNPAQKRAIDREYLPLMEKFNLPKPSVPTVPSKLSDDIRRQQIYEELIESKSNILILLGDKPIQWFLKFFDKRWKKLSDFGMNDNYSQLHQARLRDQVIQVMPIAHPRQIAKLGRSSENWYMAHQSWLKSSAPRL